MWRYFSDGPYWFTLSLLAFDWVIRIGLGIRVIMRRNTVGYTLAWLAVILLLPLLGAVIYMLFGERRLGSRRAKRIEELRAPYQAWLHSLAEDFPCEDSGLQAAAVNLRHLARGTVGIPALPGNTLQLLEEQDAFFDSLIADIDAAVSSVHLQFYIWQAGGRVNDVVHALVQAAQRGVSCRVLVDDAGSADFVKHGSFQQLLRAGVRIETMLDVGVLRGLFERLDLRNHRKIAVIDGAIGYAGSQNMVDPRLFKQDENAGVWIDAMARITGPAVEALQLTLLADWEFETFEGIDQMSEKLDLRRNQPTGDTVVQVVPSGPGLPQSAIQELVLTAIYGARRELILTTPYFIPDDAMRMALLSAAARGVDVTLVVPKKPDGRIVKLASQAYFEELLEGGVKIAQYGDGLLHTKAITVDGDVAMFGSVNLDMRSFNLNFEISLLVYSGDFTSKVCDMQARYLKSSRMIELAEWRKRPITKRFLQQLAQLLSPLL